jgi:hypothetical protein
LRSRVVTGDLASETVELLRSGLEELRVAVAASIRNPKK